MGHISQTLKQPKLHETNLNEKGLIKKITEELRYCMKRRPTPLLSKDPTLE